MRLMKALRCAAMVPLLIACATAAAAQSRTSLVPAISVTTVHDDNLFSRENAVGDWLTQVRPSLDATFETPATRTDANAWFDMQRSARHSTLNTFDAKRHAAVESRVQSTPHLSLGLVGRYDRTDNPGELNFESGVLIARQFAQRSELGPSLSYRIRERTTVSTHYTWTRETLSQQFEESLQVGRAGVARQTSPRTTWSLNYLGRVFGGASAPAPHHSNALLAGWTHQLSPTTRLTALGGPRHTTYRGTTFELLAAYIRRTPKHRVGVDFWHGETIVLGIPGPVRVASASSKISWTVRRDLEIGTSVGIFRNTALDRARTRVYHASVVGAWNPSETYILAVSYGADFQRGDIRSAFLSDARARRGVFLVRLTVAPRWRRGPQPPADLMPFSPPVKGAIQ
jgi:hypothetical protein